MVLRSCSIWSRYIIGSIPSPETFLVVEMDMNHVGKTPLRPYDGDMGMGMAN